MTNPQQPGNWSDPSWPSGQPANQDPGSPPSGQPAGYPVSGQPGGYPVSGQPGGYPVSGQPGGYPVSGQPAGYPDPTYQPAYQDPSQASGQPAGYPDPGYQQPGGSGYPPAGYPQYGYPVVAAQPTNGLAIASMVVSIIAVLGLCGYGIGGWIGVVGALLGHSAKKKIAQSGEGGDGMALAGIIMGWIAAGIALLATIAIGVAIAFAINADQTSSY